MDRLRRGFSLVELMIVVAIIGILAALAIPNFVAMQLKAKRSELPGNVDGIKTSEIAYNATNDTYLMCPPAGNMALNKQAIPWGGNPEFLELGWSPDGAVRGAYAVPEAITNDFRVEGRIDADDDGVIATYTATVARNATLGAGQENVY